MGITPLTKPVIAITGATGFLGSHLMASLLENGYRVVVLGRSTGEGSLKERINRLLRWFGIKNLSSELKCVETDLSKVRLGIDENEYSRLCSEVDSLIHCASDTSFSESKREKVMSSNVDNLKAILEFSKHAQIKILYYISTAYVAGRGSTLCLETIASAKQFTNVYEESKASAENLITLYCEKNSINLSIIRPSIVYGDSHTGRSLKFNALYFPLRSAQSIRDIYLNDLKHNEGKKALKHGIYIDNEGYLFLPLKIYLPKEGDLNIIPVDYFVNATIKIIENCSGSGIFHLTSKFPVTMKTVAMYYGELMKVRGVKILYGDPPVNELRNPAEELFDRFIEPYRPYLVDDRIFDKKNTDHVTNFMEPPEFTYEIFTICMQYAIKVNWGASIFV